MDKCTRYPELDWDVLTLTRDILRMYGIISDNVEILRIQGIVCGSTGQVWQVG